MRKKENFIVLSDFHSTQYPLNKIKEHYINEYEYIYILGDCTDRGPDSQGTGGIKMLEEIMNLTEKYPNRIIYVPGNHDSILLYTLYGNELYRYNLIQNGGANTLKECNELKENSPNRFNKLFNWLQNQPIQKIHKYNGKTYVLAHAFFNQKLYEINPNYSLLDLINERDTNIYNKAMQILWYRNGEKYNKEDLPTYKATMVIGHTPTKLLYNSDLELKNSLGKKIKVQCVDGGITRNGIMLKYTGGNSAQQTINIVHSVDSKRRLNYYIIKYHTQYAIENKKPNYRECYNDFINSALKDDGIDIINNYIISKTKKIEQKYYIYSLITIFDYMIANLINKYDSYELSFHLNNIDKFIFDNDNNYKYFTRENNVRCFARYLGRKNMLLILKLYNCSSIIEYAESKFTKGKQKKLNKNYKS